MCWGHLSDTSVQIRFRYVCGFTIEHESEQRHGLTYDELIIIKMSSRWIILHAGLSSSP